MKFENTEVWGFKHALRGMRNPKESWHLSDSTFENNEVVIGPKDMKLAQALIKGGPEHRKFLRQIFVSVDITAPLYWWKEFDTYKVGTVANSTSTMHKLMSKPITKESFEMDDYCSALNIQRANYEGSAWNVDRFVSKLIDFLEDMRQEYIRLKDDEEAQYQVWKELIRWLPESWLQTRTVTMTYENLFAMCSKGQRRFHKLNEWSGKEDKELTNFIAWARTLPYAQQFIFIDELVSPGELCAKYIREIMSKLSEESFEDFNICLIHENGEFKTVKTVFEELAKFFDKNENF